MEDEELQIISQQLWDIVNEHVGPTDKTQLLATSGMMLKTALELYTVVLSDEEIENLLDHVVRNAIPKNRAKMSEKLGERVLH
ncbi:uncharacterized protein METZ01_LOCUS72585 [marine metagenome]|uniref:Uncharacterized protein n=1 Tax=marine metagenome TaxID=408172 RepID=A0A381TWC2_9ZZZZ